MYTISTKNWKHFVILFSCWINLKQNLLMICKMCVCVAMRVWYACHSTLNRQIDAFTLTLSRFSPFEKTKLKNNILYYTGCYTKSGLNSKNADNNYSLSFLSCVLCTLLYTSTTMGMCKCIVESNALCETIEVSLSHAKTARI